MIPEVVAPSVENMLRNVVLGLVRPDMQIERSVADGKQYAGEGRKFKIVLQMAYIYSDRRVRVTGR